MNLWPEMTDPDVADVIGTLQAEGACRDLFFTCDPRCGAVDFAQALGQGVTL